MTGGARLSSARGGALGAAAWLRAEPGERWAAVACGAGPQRTRARVGTGVLGRARGAGPDGRAQVRVASWAVSCSRARFAFHFSSPSFNRFLISAKSILQPLDSLIA